MSDCCLRIGSLKGVAKHGMRDKIEARKVSWPWGPPSATKDYCPLSTRSLSAFFGPNKESVTYERLSRQIRARGCRTEDAGAQSDALSTAAGAPRVLPGEISATTDLTAFGDPIPRTTRLRCAPPYRIGWPFERSHQEYIGLRSRLLLCGKAS